MFNYNSISYSERKFDTSRINVKPFHKTLPLIFSMSLTKFLIQVLVLGLVYDDIMAKYILVKVDGSGELEATGASSEDGA